MKKWVLGSLIVLSALLIGCRASGVQDKQVRVLLAPTMPVPKEYGQALVDSSAVAGSGGGVVVDTDLSTAQTADRKIIYNVYLELIVQDTQATFDQIRQLSEEMGGFVSNANTWKENEQLRGTLTVRIPAEKLQDALSKFKALALDIESERMDSQDVTEEYVDLEARLINLQRTEKELLELLETRSATGKTADILEVHREITAVRAQIEQIQGRMKYLNNLSALATVQITLTPDKLLQPVVVGGWRPQGTAREAIRALIRTLQFFADVLIVFVLYILPVMIIIAIPVVILILIARAVWKRSRQRRQEKKAVVTH